MYSGSGYSDWEIGDITVYNQDGLYHLFHLIIPNHDYIAHAVSKDGISWRRTKNAVFVGDPGEWDDDMLWTMHVFLRKNKYCMLYTGLQRRDRGRLSRIGLAESADLTNWTKITNATFPVEPTAGIYEYAGDNPRGWLSFRDPFYFEYLGNEYILFAGRDNAGPVSRRGCVGVMQVLDDKISFLRPLIIPRVYDDVECPCVFEYNNRFYLIGSIREDIRVRYWVADSFFGTYQSFHADVLLPQGNYAARVFNDGEHLILYNFFFTAGKINSLRVLPPPKELGTDEKGRLILKSFYLWELMTMTKMEQHQLVKPELIFKNASAKFKEVDNKWYCSSESGYEIFYFDKPSHNFIWEGKISNNSLGKFGLVTHIDKEGNGYYISFDLIEGLIQLRSWGYNPGNNKENFIFSNIQTNVCIVPVSGTVEFKLICYGNYIELAVNGEVKITLMDYDWSGMGMGIYTASAAVVLEDAVIKTLPDVENEYASQEMANKLY